MTAMLVVGIAGYGVQYLARGVLGGLRALPRAERDPRRRRHRAVALALPLLAVASKDVAAAALAAAGIGGAIVPLWRCRGTSIAALRRGLEPSERFHLRAALALRRPGDGDRRLRPAARERRAAARDRRRRRGATRAAAVVFAATMLVRVPVFVFSGVAGSLLPNLTRLNAAADHRRFATTVTRACLIFAARDRRDDRCSPASSARPPCGSCTGRTT